MTLSVLNNNTPHSIRFYPELVTILEGDVVAALVLSQILYWYSPSQKTLKSKLKVRKHLTEPVYWIAKSAKEWSEELGISPKQAVRAIQTLVARGLVVTEVHRFNGSPTVHCRLEVLKGTNTTIKDSDLFCLFESFHLPLRAKPLAPEGKFLTINTAETTAAITTQIENDLQKGDSLLEQGESKGDNPSLTDTTKSTIVKPMNADSILAKFKAEGSKLKTSSTGVNALATAWKKSLSLETEGWLKPLTNKEIGQLKHVHTALGDAALPCLYFALGDWQSFALEASIQTGCTPAMHPTPGFFCQHYQVALNLMNKPKIPKVKSSNTVQSIAIVPKFVDKSQAKVCNNAYHEPKATTHDVKASLEALAAVVAANGNT